MANYNFWRGESVRLRALEQKENDNPLIPLKKRIANLNRQMTIVGFRSHVSSSGAPWK
jgi:hypothetical protein